VLLFQLVSEGARLEGRLLKHPVSYTAMVLLLAIAIAGLRRQTAARVKDKDLSLEEEYPPDLVSLNLR
jgi:hypothetical protein